MITRLRRFPDPTRPRLRTSQETYWRIYQKRGGNEEEEKLQLGAFAPGKGTDSEAEVGF